MAVAVWSLAAAFFASCGAVALIRRAGEQRIPLWIGRQPPRGRAWWCCTFAWPFCFQCAASAAARSGLAWGYALLLGVAVLVAPTVLLVRHNQRFATGQR
ncbi:hypothetical protein MN205_04620 [Kineococcus sp. TRM81007]|uniref:hypothetical protein n=1 Tax=Kineococcus sp. TRM81007 TaxID=2925831 RepID=UPI001F5AF1B8|nr:hypothetical protein [Kineococcus sp. TRM81007]MCI2237772.1 hypothetical protein [Kineococcus sp. TRM81007]